MPSKVIALDVDDAIRLYNAGESAQKIADKFGVNIKTIYRRFAAAGAELRNRHISRSITARRKYGDLSAAVIRYAAGDTMKKVCEDFDVPQRQMEKAILAAGHPLRTLRQSVGLRYTRMTRSERQSLVAKAHIARRGQKASELSQNRRAKTMEMTLQLASRADLCLCMWLAKRGVQFTPQKAVGPYNIDIAIEEFGIAVEVNGSWHYFPGRIGDELRRREYLLDQGWRLIEVRLTAVGGKVWKYLRPACADKIVTFLDEFRRDGASWGEHKMIGGDGETLT